MRAINDVARRTAIVLVMAATPVLALADNYKGPPTPCDQELSVKDVTDLFKGSASINHYSMASNAPGQGCEMGDGNAFVDIAVKKNTNNLYRGLGQFGPKRKTLASVGDEASFAGPFDSDAPGFVETSVYARKGDWICSASLVRPKGPNGAADLRITGEENFAKKLGSLCNKAFGHHS